MGLPDRHPLDCQHGYHLGKGCLECESVAALERAADGICAEVDRLREINAELLSALQKIVNNWDDLHPKDRAQARAAIAKARGETP